MIYSPSRGDLPKKYIGHFKFSGRQQKFEEHHIGFRQGQSNTRLAI